MDKTERTKYPLWLKILTLLSVLFWSFVMLHLLSGCEKRKRHDVERREAEPVVVVAPEPDIRVPSDISSDHGPAGHFLLEVLGRDGDTVLFVRWTSSQPVEAVSLVCAGDSLDPKNPSFDSVEKKTIGGSSGIIKLFLAPNMRYTCDITNFYPLGSRRGYGRFTSNPVVLITGPSAP